MKKILVILGILLVVGCSSDSDNEEKLPIVVLDPSMFIETYTYLSEDSIHGYANRYDELSKFDRKSNKKLTEGKFVFPKPLEVDLGYGEKDIHYFNIACSLVESSNEVIVCWRSRKYLSLLYIARYSLDGDLIDMFLVEGYDTSYVRLIASDSGKLFLVNSRNSPFLCEVDLENKSILPAVIDGLPSCFCDHINSDVSKRVKLYKNKLFCFGTDLVVYDLKKKNEELIIKSLFPKEQHIPRLIRTFNERFVGNEVSFEALFLMYSGEKKSLSATYSILDGKLTVRF